MRRCFSALSGLSAWQYPARRWSSRCSTGIGALFAQAHHYRSRCRSGKSRMRLVQSMPQKYSASRLPQITPTTPAIPFPQEGRIAIVTDVGRGMRWTRQRRTREWSQGGPWLVSDRTARRRPALKRLRRNPGRQHMSRSSHFGSQADGDMPGPTGSRRIANSSAMEARGIRLQGERAISRKTIAQGRPGVPAHLWSPVCIFAHDCGC
jgi:hypothetical protein